MSPVSKNNQPSPELIELHAAGAVGLIGQLRVVVANLRSYGFLVRQLVRVSLHSDFKRSFIGLGWLLILPLLSVAIWILLQGAGIVEPGDTAIPYPAFVLLSTSIWGFFAEIFRSMSRLLEANGRMLVMTPFPHETLIAERVIVHLIRFSIPFALNLIVLLIFGVKFTWWALLFPLTLIPLLLLGVAIGLFVALLRVVAVDISNLADEGIRLLMFLTPVVYAPRIQLGWLSNIVKINPLTYLVSFSRDVLTQGTFFEPRIYGICVLGVVFCFLVSLKLFRVSEPKVLERLIST